MKHILTTVIFICSLAVAGQTFATEKALPTVAYQNNGHQDLKFEYTYDSIGHFTSVKQYQLEQGVYVLSQTTERTFHRLPNGKFVMTKEVATDGLGNPRHRDETTYDDKGMELSYKSEYPHYDGTNFILRVSEWREAIVNGAGVRTGMRVWNETTQQLETSTNYAFDSKGRITNFTSVDDYDGYARMITITYTWGDGLNELLTVTMNDDGTIINATNIVFAKNGEYFNPYGLSPIDDIGIFGGSSDMSSSQPNLSDGKQFVWEDNKLYEIFSNSNISAFGQTGNVVCTITDNVWTKKLTLVGLISETTVITKLANGGWKEDVFDDEGYSRTKIREYDENGLLTKDYTRWGDDDGGDETEKIYEREYNTQNRLTKTTYTFPYQTPLVETYTSWSTDAPEPATSVTLNKNATTLTVGNTEQLTATVNPKNATNKNVTWASNNTSVATVSQSGFITAVSEGTATITVTTTDGGHQAHCTVTVEPDVVAVTSVTLDKNTATLTVGDTEQLTATVNPENATNKNVTWASNNTSVATVSTTGFITAVSDGTATITVTTDDGGHTATATVNIIEIGDCNESALLIVKLYDSIATLLYNINGLNTDIANRDIIIDGLNTDIANQNIIIAGLNSDIANQNIIIAGLNSEVSGLIADTLRLYNLVVALGLEKNDLTDSIISLLQQLDDCKNSGTSNANLIPQEQIQIFPNPVNYELRIINYEWQPGDIVELFDMNGRRVYVAQPPFSVDRVPFTIDMSAFQS
ncbi:MAG: Ig domain-containing protein, partial [Bacteroidales bacterium]|nr:Ig domain-containing protein [Bacteroidales bacterium]